MTKVFDLLFDRLDGATRECYLAGGLLVLRITAGVFMLGHGWGKLAGFTATAAHFPDPLGVGSNLSLGLTVFAEFFCALAVILGLFTRVATVPLIITMLVAAFVIHGPDPWMKKEFPLLYAGIWLALFVAGPGRYSLDHLLWRRKNEA